MAHTENPNPYQICQLSKNFCPGQEHRLLQRKKKGPCAFEESQNHIFFCVGLCVIFPGLLRVSVHGKLLDWKVDFDFDVQFLSLLFFAFFFFTLVAKIPFVFQVLNGLENTLHNSRVSCNKSSQAFWKKWQNLGSSSLVQFSLSSGKSC